MKRSRESNRVTWAPGLNLCQVRQFVAEDCPSKVGIQTQDHLQNKALVHHLNVKEFNDLPPGFEGSLNLNPLKGIPKIEWNFPPKVVTSHNWNVAAGEESHEAENQKFREMRVLEAVFPRASAIPPSPYISLDVEGEYYDDSLTPIIPLTPIEEDVAADMPSLLSAPPITCLYSQSSVITQDLPSSGTCNTPILQLPASEKPVARILPDVGTDLITASSAAVAALKKSKVESLIDTDLLIKIFTDPTMIKKLLKDGQAPKSKPQTRLMPPSCKISPVTSIASSPVDGNLCGPGRLEPKLTPVPRAMPSYCHESTTISMLMPPDGSLLPPLCEVQPMLPRMPPLPETVSSVSLPRPESITSSINASPVSNWCAMSVQVRSSSSAPKTVIEQGTNQVPNIMLAQPKVNGAPNCNPVTMETNPVKDISYIKNLIREHGSEKKELVNRNMSYNGSHPNYFKNVEFEQNVIQRDVRCKFQKPCLYYRSPRGCRHGSNCPYKHDLSFQFQTSGTLEGPVAKKMKFGVEITGRT